MPPARVRGRHAWQARTMTWPRGATAGRMGRARRAQRTSRPPRRCRTAGPGPGPHQHRPQPVQHRPRRLVGADLQRALRAQRGDAVLLRGEHPAGGEPHRQRRPPAVEQRACRRTGRLIRGPRHREYLCWVASVLACQGFCLPRRGPRSWFIEVLNRSSPSKSDLIGLWARRDARTPYPLMASTVSPPRATLAPAGRGQQVGEDQADGTKLQVTDGSLWRGPVTGVLHEPDRAGRRRPSARCRCVCLCPDHGS